MHNFSASETDSMFRYLAMFLRWKKAVFLTYKIWLWKDKLLSTVVLSSTVEDEVTVHPSKSGFRMNYFIKQRKNSTHLCCCDQFDMLWSKWGDNDTQSLVWTKLASCLIFVDAVYENSFVYRHKMHIFLMAQSEDDLLIFWWKSDKLSRRSSEK